MINMEWPHSPFWDWSLAVYGRAGVEAACLELQHRHGLDVNLVLLCCWLGARGVELDEGACDRLKYLSRCWQLDVVRPLRAIRRQLKVALAHPEAAGVCARLPDLAGALRARVLELELDGEHIEQLALEGAVSEMTARAGPGPRLATQNLACYWRFTDIDRGALSVLLRAVFADNGADDIDAALNALPAAPPGGG